MEDEATRLARKGFEAYAKNAGAHWRLWEELPGFLQDAWREAADEIAREVTLQVATNGL